MTDNFMFDDKTQSQSPSTSQPSMAPSSPPSDPARPRSLSLGELPQSAGAPDLSKEGDLAIPEPTVMPAPGGVAPAPKQEPKDMFADVDAQATGNQAPGSTASGGYTFEEDEQKPLFLKKRFVILLLGAVLLLIIVIFGVQFALRIFSKAQSSQPPPTVQQQSVSPTKPSESPSAVAPSQAEPPSSQTPASGQQGAQQDSDTDSDGLLDSEEKALGTNETLGDTDGDGLSDREEFRGFGTDPLKPDTDGDGYLDGVEVKSGYNPNGSGKLLNAPTQAP